MHLIWRNAAGYRSRDGDLHLESSTAGELAMTRNVGGIDRILRALVGVVMLGLTWYGTIGLWGLLGLVPLGTALIGFCPLYTLLGIATCPVGSKAS